MSSRRNQESFRHAEHLDVEDPPFTGWPGRLPATAHLHPYPLQRRADGGEVRADADGAVARAASGQGEPLPDAIRARFESCLGVDLCGVRTYTGADSAEAASSVGAHAYAVGQQIHFAEGRYRPSSADGLRLLAHEVAHTVQQSGAAPQRQHKLEVSSAGDAMEREADAAADAMVSGQPVSALSSVGGAPVQRWVEEKMGKPSGGAGVEVSSTGVAVTLSGKFSHEMDAGYATIEFGAPLSVSASLKLKAEAAASTSAGGKTDGSAGASVSVEVYKEEAKTAGTDKIKELAKKSVSDGEPWTITKVEWENEGGVSGPDSSGERSFSVATGVKFTYRNGQSSTVKAVLFEKGGESGLKGPSLELAHKMDLDKVTLWSNADAELTAQGSVGVTVAVKPNWTKIFAELAKTGGKAMARSFLRAAMQAITGEMLVVGGFVLGGVATIFTVVKQAIANKDFRAAKLGAENAVDGYVNGFCTSWGCELPGGGTAAFRAQGASDGASKLAAQVAKIQQHPVYAPWDFTAEELTTALKEKLAGHGAEIYSQCEAAVRPKINREFVLAFFEAQKDWNLDYIARNDARKLARQLGVPEEDVPEE